MVGEVHADGTNADEDLARADLGIRGVLEAHDLGAALLMDATADLFIRTCYNYPTLSELYKYATYDALGRRDEVGSF